MTEIERGEVRLKADFNTVRDGETVVARFDFDGSAASLPHEGERVEIYDPEGNRCSGEVIARVDDDRFRVRLDYATWEDGGVLAPTVDLMEALRQSVARTVEARTRGQETGPEREEVDDFTVSAA
jgi:hypothetical protein